MNILTFDIEEWFHILDNASTRTENEWACFSPRIHENVERILRVLEAKKVKATFFCLGWIVDKYPEIIRRIVERGYEVGSHTHTHQLIYEQDAESFKSDLARSVRSLEDVTGRKTRYFRAPGFSISEANKWAFEVIAGLGIEIDCSVFPATRAHGGFPSYREPVPSIISYNGIRLKEMPINCADLLGRPVIFSGGGYFRLIPYPMIRSWTRRTNYLMSYLHPRDFDPWQPMLRELPLARKFKCYFGLRGALRKLEKWLDDFEFIDVGTADSLIDWSKAPVVRL